MSRTLLAIARPDECDSLIGTALRNGWSVLNTASPADIPVVLSARNIDLIVVSRRCVIRGDLAGYSFDVWCGDYRTPVIICDSRYDLDSLDHFFGSPPRETNSHALAHAGDRAFRSLSPTLSLIESQPANKNNGVDRAIALIEKSYAEPLSLADAAAAACYSRCHFSKVFKDTIGVGFTAYLSLVRVRHAAELLADSEESITDIAFLVGFNDLSNFERVFRQFHHVSPSKFRQRAKLPKSTQLFRTSAQ